MTAVPTAGGQQKSVSGDAPAGGVWGPLTVAGLQANTQYTVYVTITFIQAGTMSTQQITSSTAIVTTPP
jgi:hypothetical protein